MRVSVELILVDPPRDPPLRTTGIHRPVSPDHGDPFHWRGSLGYEINRVRPPRFALTLHHQIPDGHVISRDSKHHGDLPHMPNLGGWGTAAGEMVRGGGARMGRREGGDGGERRVGGMG